MRKAGKYCLAGALAGTVNGLFGGGGGIPLVMLLTRRAGLADKTAFATAVAVIFPLCIVSAGIYYLRCGLDIASVLPYLLGGTAGGIVGGRLFKTVPGPWLRRLFALFLLYGAARYLLA